MNSIGLMVTGNEVLLGKIKDVNGTNIAYLLSSKGIEISSMVYARDCVEDLVRGLNFLADSCDTIIVIGGIGSSIPDLTSEAVSSFSGLSLQFSDAAWNVCADHFSRTGVVSVPETHRKQAMLPKGSMVFPGIAGTNMGFSCDFLCRNRTYRIYCLPGSSHEIEEIFLHYVLPELASTKKVAKNTEKNIVATMQSFLGDSASHYDEQVFCESFVAEMSNKNLLFACAESCTGGLISSKITSVSGSSRMFSGGVVSYSNASKSDLLGVDPREIERFGSVSTQVALQMVVGVRSAFGSDLALSVTGVAGPLGGTEVHPVGCVCFGLTIASKRIIDFKELLRVLNGFGWVLASTNSEDVLQNASVEFVVERRFGEGFSRERIQHMSANFGMGSIIAILEFTR